MNVNNNSFNVDEVEEDCVICMAKESDIKILPCNHFFCEECIETLRKSSTQCPACRGHMEGFVGLSTLVMFSSSSVVLI